MGKKGLKRYFSPLVVPGADQLNFDTFNDYYYRLLNIAVNTIKWVNLPSEIDPRYLEIILMSKGFALFFKEDLIDKYAALECMIGGPLNIYRIPKMRMAYAVNGYQKECNPDNSVIIFDNYMRVIPVNTLTLYARRLAEVERAIDVNVKGMKFPILILAEESQQLTMKNLMEQYDGNVPFIFGYKGLSDNEVKVMETGSPYVGDKLNQLKRQYWTDAMQFLGVESTTVEKRERLVADEATATLGTVAANRFTRLNSRSDACKQINEMFGLNVSVQFRDEINIDARLEVKQNESMDNTDSLVDFTKLGLWTKNISDI